MSKATKLLERLDSVNQITINEEDFDPMMNKKTGDEENNEPEKQDEDDEETIDNEEPDNQEDGSDSDVQLEAIEMKFIDALTEQGLISCEAEKEDNSLSIDLTFENGDNFSIQMQVVDGVGKTIIMKSGNDEPISEMDLPSEFVDEVGNLIVNVDSIPVESISKSLTDNLTSVGNDEEPVQEFYRYKDGLVESFSKSVKLEKKVSMRYKKESKKKKRK